MVKSQHRQPLRSIRSISAHQQAALAQKCDCSQSCCSPFFPSKSPAESASFVYSSCTAVQTFRPTACADESERNPIAESIVKAVWYAAHIRTQSTSMLMSCDLLTRCTFESSSLSGFLYVQNAIASSGCSLPLVCARIAY